MSAKYFAAVLMALTWMYGTDACGPGAMYGSRRRLPRKLTPLVLKESYPSTSEYSLSASGPFTTQLTLEHNRFRELVPNYNTDISFQDSEGSGEDHLMSRRCKEKLDTLAISTMNQYPGVRLRVLEAFDTENVHQPNSLHYEGRAVDISVSDRDRSKLGMLARLAIEAGFDYVNYRSKWHIHASVKTESTDISRSGGCFPANATVTTPTGPKRMSDLEIGDRVLVSTPDGDLTFSPVLLFLHRESGKQKRLYITITTDQQQQIMLTASHLIYVADNPDAGVADSYVTFAKNVQVGHYLYVVANGSIELQKVTDITGRVQVDHYAPLTSEGSVVVNNVLASCYAMIESHELAHAAFRPMRMILNSKEAAVHLLKTLQPFKSKEDKTSNEDKTPRNDFDKGGGIHWYAEMLYKLSYYVLPENYLYQ